MRLCLLALCLLSSACRCSAPGLLVVRPEDLSVSPRALALPETYVGQSSSAMISVDNLGGVSATLPIITTFPFSADTAELVLGKGASAIITVTFTPTSEGLHEATLQIGPVTAQLTGVGLAVPECTAEVCHDAQFDFALRQCTSATRPDGAQCQTACVSGQCTAGTCVGTSIACDDGDACTVDACSETNGCTHVERRCPPPTNPCQVASCDSASGCGAVDADDGTLCGPDQCLSPSVAICVSGQCVTRVRPVEARCTNTWVPTAFFARRYPAVTYDPIRRRVLLFGGYSGISPQNDTWEWDGNSWSMRTPANSPPATSTPGLVWDSARSRAVLVTALGDVPHTWEWDGVTWLERDPTHTLPARAQPGLAYDSGRRRVVLFGGFANGYLGDTWEWDGSRWEQKHPAVSPSPRMGPTMAYDPDRRRVVLFGGDRFRDDTWEWDGINWVEATPAMSPPGREGRLAWNAARHRVALFGGRTSNDTLGDLWEWDGVSWQELQSTTPPPTRGEHGLAWDDARSELLTVAGSLGSQTLADTWVWNGSGWSSRTPLAPEVRTIHSMAFDERRGRVVMFGGVPSGSGAVPADTWEWDGTQWFRAATTGPGPRMGHELTWDPLRERVVMFGGRPDGGIAFTNETWEWDGATWTLRSPPTSPAPRAHFAMTFDRARGEVVLVSQSTTDAASWVWNGSTWAPGLTSAPNVRASALSFHEGLQQLVFHDGFGQATWTLEAAPGSQWQRVFPATPPTVDSYAMAYDRLRQRVIAVGARGPSMWEWDGVSWTRVQPGRFPPQSQFTNALVFDSARQRLMLTGEAGPWIFLP